MKEDIKDTEIRIIGADAAAGRKTPAWVWVVVGVACMALLIGLIVFFVSHRSTKAEIGVYEQAEMAQQSVQPHPLREWISSLDTVHAVGTVTKDTMVNDIPLRIYVPLNARPRLELGYGITKHREEHILFFQAADIRADNKKIVGAFVLQGNVLSRGLSKRGYCAIIDGEITVGVADNSPLFEEATEKDGYFFRQYPLVDKGTLVENELKSKSIRRGLCELEGRIVVVETETTESLHDFAQALVDIGTQNAIYLVGSTAIGWACDTEGNGTKMGLWDNRAFRNVNFIVWGR